MKMHPTETNPKHILKYWIQERGRIRIAKEAGEPKPWSDDPIFQDVYFTNVHREDDKVTKFIRKWIADGYWGAENRGHNASQIVFNLISCRLINWPDTIEHVGWWNAFDPEMFIDAIKMLEGKKVWGDAYIVSTCGQKIPKVEYMATLLEEIQLDLSESRHNFKITTCKEAHEYFLTLRGLSDFMAAQIVADVKHTPRMSLNTAPDFDTFAKPGPGSLRGLAWYYELDKVTKGDFYPLIKQAHEELGLPPEFEMQDLQNCFCEYDKYMRINNGTGRSKRKYDGI